MNADPVVVAFRGEECLGAVVLGFVLEDDAIRHAREVNRSSRITKIRAYALPHDTADMYEFERHDAADEALFAAYPEARRLKWSR